MSDESARPSRFHQPAGDYRPPAPPPRRAGADHSHIPHSLEKPVEHPFSVMNPTGRRIAVLAELRREPATTVQLRERLEIEASTSAAKDLDNAIQTLQRSGDIQGERVPGGPHKRWVVTGLGAARQDRESDRVVAEGSSDPAGEPQAATVPEPAPGDGVPGPDWQPPEDWSQPPGRICELPPELNPAVTPGRVGMTADGHLLIWLPGKALPLELCQRTTAGIARLTELNRPLIREE